MFAIFFDGLDDRYKSGMTEFAKEFGFCVSCDSTEYDLKIILNLTDSDEIFIQRTGTEVTIKYKYPSHIFRAVGLVLQNIKDESYCLTETVYIEDVIAMFDVSQADALIRPKYVFKMLRSLAAMGFTSFMLYMEDCYEIKDDPHFGYMRPRYTYDDLKAIDDYAYALGIEAIPCMQTLGHLPGVLKWHYYNNIKDGATTLMVGCDDTYAFIRRMLETATAPLRTKRIHIGMDEAFDLGLGEYLRKNGYTENNEIIKQHLSRVSEIIADMGLEPMMWGDMFFRAINGGVYYLDREVEFPQEVIDSIPPNMEIVYWDYVGDEARITNMIKQNKKLNRDVIYAGSLRNCRSFACRHEINTIMADRALSICKEQGIKKAMATVWGDNCTESFAFGALLGLQLYAEHAFSKDIDHAKWYERFRFCTRCDAEPFEALDLFDKIPGFVETDTSETNNISKCLLWQDPLLGMFDHDIEAYPEIEKHYADLGKLLERYAQNSENYNELLSYYSVAAYTLADKAMLGVKIRKAYKEKDNDAISKMITEIDKVINSVEELRKKHRSMWMEFCKSIGWEVQDIRYGALLGRLDTAKHRIAEFLSGQIDVIEELEEKQLPYFGCFGYPFEYEWTRIVTASKL